MSRTILNLFLVVWIATWTAHLSYSKPCELPDPIRNPYTDEIDGEKTRQAYASYSARSCGETEIQKHLTREFPSREEAETFKNGCPKDVCGEWVIRKKEKESSSQ